MIAETFRTEIRSSLSSVSRPPKLVGILATSSAPSKFYAEFTKKQCDAFEVEFVLRRTGAAADESLAPGEGVEEAIAGDLFGECGEAKVGDFEVVGIIEEEVLWLEVPVVDATCMAVFDGGDSLAEVALGEVLKRWPRAMHA